MTSAPASARRIRIRESKSNWGDEGSDWAPPGGELSAISKGSNGSLGIRLRSRRPAYTIAPQRGRIEAPAHLPLIAANRFSMATASSARPTRRRPYRRRGTLRWHTTSSGCPERPRARRTRTATSGWAGSVLWTLPPNKIVCPRPGSYARLSVMADFFQLQSSRADRPRSPNSWRAAAAVCSLVPRTPPRASYEERLDRS